MLNKLRKQLKIVHGPNKFEIGHCPIAHDDGSNSNNA